MGNGPDGLIMSQARDRAAIDKFEDASFGPGCGVGRLIENAPHVAVALRRAVAVVHSRAFVVAGAGVLREIFRGKFVDALEQAFQNGQLRFEGDLKLLAQPKIFAAWLRPLFRQDWVVYLKRPFGGAEYVLQYLIS